MSRFLFIAHVWSLLPSPALDTWEAALRPMLYALARPALRGLAPFAFTVNTLCGLCRVLPPRDALHVARLRYLKRLVSHCPPILWNLLCATQHQSASWIASLRQSFAWLATFSSRHFGLGADSCLADWISFVAVDSCWKGRLKRAVASCKAYRHTHAATEVWHAGLSASFAQWGVDFSQTHAPDVDLPWTCDLCDRAFANKVALSMHAVKSHGYQTLVRHYAIDGTCSNCSRDFHHRSRFSFLRYQ
eukprot:s2429_g10.t1